MTIKATSTITLRLRAWQSMTDSYVLGAGMVDFDNDGWPDLFVVTGNVYPELESRFPEFQRRALVYFIEI
jgi:hypothetical protein